MQTDPMLSLQDVARLLAVHKHTVWHMVKGGFIPAYHVGRRGDLRFKPEDVEEYLERVRVRI